MGTRLATPDSGGEPDRATWTRAGGWLIPLAAVGLLVALKPEIVRGTFSSAESALRVAAAIAAWIVFSWFVRRVVPNPLARTALIAVAAAGLLWLNVAPYFDEDVRVAGGFPDSQPSGDEAALTPAPGEMEPVDSAPPTPAAAPSPVQLTNGRFRGLDGHRGSGEAAVLRQPDGSHVVAFRDLSVSSVPDPVVYLVPGAGEAIDGGTRLGRFDPRRDRYEIPPGTDLDQPFTVLIWCQRFAVPVAGATQSTA